MIVKIIKTLKAYKVVQKPLKILGFIPRQQGCILSIFRTPTVLSFETKKTALLTWYKKIKSVAYSSQRSQTDQLDF